MQVTSITVLRRRSIQPEQYGNTTAELQVSVNLDEGEDWQEKARELLVSTRALVYENLGLKLPASVTGTKEQANDTETTKVDVKTDTPKDKPKRGPGRPPKADKSSDLPGVVEGSDDDTKDSDAPSGDSETEDSSPQTMTQDDLQTKLIEFIKAKGRGNPGVDIHTVRKIMQEVAGVIKSGDVPDDKVVAVYEAVKAAVA